MDSVSSFPALKIYSQGSQLVVQPVSTGSDAASTETLHVDLQTGKVSVSAKPGPPQSATAIDAMGLLGIAKLHKGSCLLAITAARRVATLNGADVYELRGAKVLTDPEYAKDKANRALVKLLQDAVDPECHGRGIYFSHFYDLTLTAQRRDVVTANPTTAALPLAQRADTRFFYNRHLAQPLLLAKADRFVVPCVLGFVRQLADLNFSTGGKTALATLTLIARRGVDRAGTRQWRRGADNAGNVANFVETEQLLTYNGTTASYVEVRGSIPLLWTQLPNIKYKPTTVIAAPGESSAMFDSHFQGLRELYKDVVAINLINHKGTEGKLEVAFRQEAQRYCSTNTGLRYLAFDFHHECSKGRYHRLSLLWDKVREDFERHGFYERREGQGVVRRQEGVVRTNCIDCLDRTNVLQGVLARKALELVLVELGLMPPGATLPSAFPAVEQEFKVLWADHGDAVSAQYAGTGAMKSGFTRTGKRTFGGLIDDGYKAVARYYFNNFQDGRKQDAMDLLTGAYTVVEGAPLPIKSQPSPLLPIMLALVAIVYGAHQLGQLLTGNLAAGIAAATAAAGDAASSSSLAAAEATAQNASGAGGAGAGVGLQVVVKQVLLPLVLGLGLLVVVVQNGKHLVNKPQLCPQLAVTVAKTKKK